MTEKQTTRTEADCLHRSRSDPDAFGDLAERYVLRLDAWFRSRTGDPAAAAGLTAETFARAWQGAPSFRDDATGSAGAWLYGIALDLLRGYERSHQVASAARRRLGMPVRDYSAITGREGAPGLRRHASFLQQAVTDLGTDLDRDPGA